ncbi:hypothetical protein FRX31_003469 [Thalictrum thalictroides]|uniref:RNase H type-1 domain-containing protein n=1 Tax=Thalictrum thalictroides TaxID=46969 RepID=A0A7J6XAX1_THATH|nr:hypothetical protein FRX31_003469 [Thalictrum thalictroides]
MGVKGALILHLESIEVSTDSLRAARIINGMEAPPWYGKDLAAAIQASSKGSKQFAIKHNFRECNRAVDHLAGLGTKGNQSIHYFVGPFDCKVSSFLDEDRQGYLYARIYSKEIGWGRPNPILLSK